jgi:hypothetical protein
MYFGYRLCPCMIRFCIGLKFDVILFIFPVTKSSIEHTLILSVVIPTTVERSVIRSVAREVQNEFSTLHAVELRETVVLANFHMPSDFYF